MGRGGGGVAIVPHWIWKIVRPSEKILATPLTHLVTTVPIVLNSVIYISKDFPSHFALAHLVTAVPIVLNSVIDILMIWRSPSQ